MKDALGVLFQPASSANAAPGTAYEGEGKAGTFDDALSAFISVRSRLFGIAYRIVRSAAEAEDVVQDVWIRWQTADRSVVRDAPAFLATTTTRLAINVIQSARSRRETVRRTLAAGTSRHERRPSVGGGTRRGAGGGDSALDGEAVAYGTSRLHPSRGVRLSIPRYRERPSARRGQRAPSSDSRSATRCP